VKRQSFPALHLKRDSLTNQISSTSNTISSITLDNQTRVELQILCSVSLTSCTLSSLHCTHTHSVRVVLGFATAAIANYLKNLCGFGIANPI
jgi:FlaG/FlaF family flagellin (archaellin)